MCNCEKCHYFGEDIHMKEEKEINKCYKCGVMLDVCRISTNVPDKREFCSEYCIIKAQEDGVGDEDGDMNYELIENKYF